eukprot:1196149-Prorocentrum_minimum.AAC.6
MGASAPMFSDGAPKNPSGKICKPLPYVIRYIMHYVVHYLVHYIVRYVVHYVITAGRSARRVIASWLRLSSTNTPGRTRSPPPILESSCTCPAFGTAETVALLTNVSSGAPMKSCQHTRLALEHQWEAASTRGQLLIANEKPPAHAEPRRPACIPLGKDQNRRGVDESLPEVNKGELPGAWDALFGIREFTGGGQEGVRRGLGGD